MRRRLPIRASFVRSLTLVLILLMLPAPDWATCGGGGGGGAGGMSRGAVGASVIPEQETYPVPWRERKPQDPPLTMGLVVYWFPTGVTEFQRSSLRNSRSLALYASHCVSMEVADVRSPSGQKFASDAKLPVVVLAQADGTVIGKAENKNGFLRVDQVEQLVGNEMKRREETLKAQLKEAKEKEKSGDTQGAIPLYRSVLEQKCLFPSQAKNAAKALKKLGVEVESVGEVQGEPVFDPAKSAAIERTMRQGLAAELQAKYPEAQRFYAKAHRMDPADPAPLRYLGELYRHDFGDWTKARSTFSEILAMPADPLSRAVALHGLGKMTVHEGAFKEGLALMEKSVETYPLPLAYRNLAVYWNSEGDAMKTNRYVEKALALDPTDPYNLVFAAVFKAASGHRDEALKIARENEALLPASYNLAAIYAQAGDKERALALLRRHFFAYERYQAVRSKEMMEARVDFVFALLREDPAFVTLTRGADGRLPLPAGGSAAQGMN